jgi:hypothetical protein
MQTTVPPPFAVVSARRFLTDEDCTADIIGQLASIAAGIEGAKLDGDVIVRYRFEGTGPYCMFSERWPPLPQTSVTPMERQIVAAYAFISPDEEEEEEEDVTDEVAEFAGPDASAEFPEKLAKKRGWRKLVINYADGSERVATFQ